jgi:hypothetical protein
MDASTNFKDLLSHGVVVSVNGQPWNRIVAHVSDADEDETAGAGLADDEHEEEEWEDEWEALPAGTEDGETGGMGSEENGAVTRRRRGRARGVVSGSRGDGGLVRRRKAEGKVERQDKDRAVVVVYGLSPGKEYEIELRVVGLSGADADGLGK